MPLPIIVLDAMTDEEVQALAREAFPSIAEQLVREPDLRGWLRENARWESLSTMIPLPTIVRIRDATTEARKNAARSPDLGLDDISRQRIRRDLSRMQGILVERGREYVGSLTDLEWSDRDGMWTARVKGTSTYDVVLNTLGKGGCSCPYSKWSLPCKHLAALRMELLQDSPNEPAATTPKSALPASVAGTDPRVAKAIDLVKRVGRSLRARPWDEAPPRSRVVYVLETGRLLGRLHPEVDLVPQRESFSVSRGWTVDEKDLRKVLGRRLHLDPPKYATEHDLRMIRSCLPVMGPGYREIPGDMLGPMLEASRRGVLVDFGGDPVTIDPGLWRMVPILTEGAGECRFRIRFEEIASDTQRIEEDDLWTYFGREGQWFVSFGNRLLQLDPRTPSALFSLAEPSLRIPAERLREVRGELVELSRHGCVIDAANLPAVRKSAPLRRARLRSLSNGVVLTFVEAYPEVEIPESSMDRVVAFTDHNGDLQELERDLEAELVLEAELEDLLVESSIEFDRDELVEGWRIRDPESLRRLALMGLPAMAATGWELRDAGLVDPWRRRRGAVTVSGKASGQDWFEVSGVVDFDGIEVALSTLVGRRGDLKLSDGSTGEISEALRRRLRWLETLGEVSDSGIRLRRVHAALAADLEGAGLVQVRHPEVWKRQLQELMSRPMPSMEVPGSLVAQLRPYQKAGYEWLVSLRTQGLGGILADDMGLGKTVQMIALLCHVYEQQPDALPALVVGPASVVGNWLSELERFAPHLRARLLHGNDRETLRDAPIEGPTIFVTTYGTLPREMEWASKVEFSVLVLDESQAIRNPATVTHKSCTALKAQQKVCLTGTPIENSLADLWAQYSFLNPGLLGPKDEFLAQFTPEPGATPDLGRLRSLTSPFWLRRTKSLVARDLPEREDVVLGVDLDPKQAALYQRQLHDYQKHLLPELRRKGLEDGGRFQVFTALLRLRQIACAPALAGHKGPSAKLDVLLDRLAENAAEGHRALVFSSFTSLLDLVEERLRKASMEFLRVDGSTPAAQRTRLIRRFQDRGAESIFLVSLKAGGAGINLTAADDVFLLDPWWNPAVEEQAAARAHRIGRTDPVTVYRMVAKGTIEERVLALSRGKAALASALFDSGETGGAVLTMEIVQELLA